MHQKVILKDPAGFERLAMVAKTRIYHKCVHSCNVQWNLSADKAKRTMIASRLRQARARIGLWFKAGRSVPLLGVCTDDGIISSPEGINIPLQSFVVMIKLLLSMLFFNFFFYFI